MRRPRIFVLVALVVGAFTFLVVDRDEPPGITVEADDLSNRSPEEQVASPTTEPAPEEDLPDPPAGFDSYRNRAGYAFAYPEAWNLDERRTAVEILAPDASVAISFGVAPGRDVSAAIGELLNAIEGRYDVSEVRGPNSSAVGEDEVVSVSGSAVNDEGVPIDFTAMVIEGPARNYAITVFGRDDTDQGEIRAILDSFATF